MENKRCSECGGPLIEGKVEVKAISGNGLAFPIISFVEKGLKRFSKQRIVLNNNENSYYCEKCRKVFVEYSVKKGK